MKLLEYRGDDALDVLAEALEPAAEIFGDPEFKEAWKVTRATAISLAIKKHKRAVFCLLAALECVDYRNDVSLEAYKQRFTVFTLPARLLEIFNTPELVSLFMSPDQSGTEASFGSVTANTEATDAE